MANYREYSVREVSDPNRVGLGLGDVDGEDRICVSLEGDKINPDLATEWQAINWTSLTPAAARRLWELLGDARHIWEAEPKTSAR